MTIRYALFENKLMHAAANECVAMVTAIGNGGINSSYCLE